MKKIFFSVIAVIGSVIALSQGKIGINTTTPSAMLHVKDSSVLFSGGASSPPTPGNPPVSGVGIRMMWYPDKAAFRVGRLSAGSQSTFWDKDSIGNASFATGINTKAKGGGSVAFGSSTQATGSPSFAAGSNSIASGNNATALGGFNDATGDNSIALGLATSALGENSLSVGDGSIAYGDNSIASGFFAEAMGPQSVSLGTGNLTIGHSSFSAGSNNIVTGHQAVAFGQGISARAYCLLAIGRNNDTSSSHSVSTWIDTDPLFVIGNGASISSRKNAFTVLKNGKFGVNTPSPQSLFHLKGIDGTENMHLRLEDNNSADPALIYYVGDLVFKNNRSGGDFYFKDHLGNNAMALFSSGNMTIAGGLTQNSDARLKKNIQPLQNSLQKIIRLNGYQYNWIDNNRDQSIQTGVLAQEIEKQMPELISTDKEGVKSVNYSGLIPYLIEAMKTQQQKINELEQELLLLKKKIN